MCNRISSILCNTTLCHLKYHKWCKHLQDVNILWLLDVFPCAYPTAAEQADTLSLYYTQLSLRCWSGTVGGTVDGSSSSGYGLMLTSAYVANGILFSFSGRNLNFGSILVPYMQSCVVCVLLVPSCTRLWPPDYDGSVRIQEQLQR